ncbi:Mimecan [Dissostichus eleginoides]|uniref:Mimecan n=1 Tax=Dissostichus eleginoides TaxID=100907 RepID=A0AAD9CBC3_DISEL|nr:Mimecan [Dissostichus eleginoides]
MEEQFLMATSGYVNSRARIRGVLQAGDSDFVAAACAETDMPACFICKAASQKAQCPQGMPHNSFVAAKL